VGGDVLVVDDNADVVEALTLLLQSAGYETRAASDGRQALEAVREKRPALVLLDVLMPVMDGWECARLLHERYGRTLPIVIVTAGEHARSRAEEAGADGVLPKPFDVDELLDLVSRYARPLAAPRPPTSRDAGSARTRHTDEADRPVIGVRSQESDGSGEGGRVGLFDFVKDAGRKVGMFGGRKAAEADAAKEEAAAAAKGADAEQALARDIRAAVLSYVEIRDLTVDVRGEQATISGSARTQEEREKAVLVAGNTIGIARVDDRLVVAVAETPAQYYTVARGDTLGEIAKRFYGDAKRYNEIFDANRPMLEHPDRIYPGQVLRIPTRTPVT
jgi:CheY-like chemotaxis protein/nucleoid-associated protein YgaU